MKMIPWLSILLLFAMANSNSPAQEKEDARTMMISVKSDNGGAWLGGRRSVGIRRR